MSALVVNLPDDSALHKTLGLGWSQTNELLALNAELLDQGNLLFIEANKKKSARTPDPIKIYRPNERLSEAVEAKPEQSSTEDVRAFFGFRYQGGEEV